MYSRFALLRAAVIAFGATGYEGYQYWDASIQRLKIAGQGLPPGLFDVQGSVDSLKLTRDVSDLTWLRNTRLRDLTLSASGSSPAGLKQLMGVTSLSLDLGRPSFRAPQIASPAGLELPARLASLSLGLNYSQIATLADLKLPTGLSSLSLDLEESRVASLAGLEQLKGLTSLSIDLDRFLSPVWQAWSFPRVSPRRMSPYPRRCFRTFPA